MTLGRRALCFMFGAPLLAAGAWVLIADLSGGEIQRRILFAGVAMAGAGLFLIASAVAPTLMSRF